MSKINGKVYCLRSYQTDDIYIGSTIQSLSMRMCGHRSDYKKYLEKRYHYVSSFEILKYDDNYIELIEQFENITKEELRKYEGECIRKMKCVNHRIESRTKKEWRDDHKEYMTEYFKKRYDNNKENIVQKRREKILCECGTYTQRNHLWSHKKTKKHLDLINSKN